MQASHSPFLIVYHADQSYSSSSCYHFYHPTSFRAFADQKNRDAVWDPCFIGVLGFWPWPFAWYLVKLPGRPPPAAGSVSPSPVWHESSAGLHTARSAQPVRLRASSSEPPPSFQPEPRTPPAHASVSVAPPHASYSSPSTANKVSDKDSMQVSKYWFKKHFIASIIALAMSAPERLLHLLPPPDGLSDHPVLGSGQHAASLPESSDIHSVSNSVCFKMTANQTYCQNLQTFSCLQWRN